MAMHQKQTPCQEGGGPCGGEHGGGDGGGGGDHGSDDIPLGPPAAVYMGASTATRQSEPSAHRDRPRLNSTDCRSRSAAQRRTALRCCWRWRLLCQRIDRY